jgi:hypothetical protein
MYPFSRGDMMPIFVGLFSYVPKECCNYGYLIGLGLFLVILYFILEKISPRKKSRIKKRSKK